MARPLKKFKILNKEGKTVEYVSAHYFQILLGGNRVALYHDVDDSVNDKCVASFPGDFSVILLNP